MLRLSCCASPLKPSVHIFLTTDAGHFKHSISATCLMHWLYMLTARCIDRTHMLAFLGFEPRTCTHAQCTTSVPFITLTVPSAEPETKKSPPCATCMCNAHVHSKCNTRQFRPYILLHTCVSCSTILTITVLLSKPHTAIYSPHITTICSATFLHTVIAIL